MREEDKVNQESRLMKIGEIAEKSGMTPRSIRYYEEIGLLRPKDRSDGRYRLYGDSELTRLEYIRRLADAGLSLADISALFRVWEASESGDERRTLMLKAAVVYRDCLDRKRRAIEFAKRELDLLLDSVENCNGCRLRPAKEVCGECEVVLSRATLPDLAHAWFGKDSEVMFEAAK